MENQKAEDGKYYTPKIEEFHTDFEYEVLDRNGNWLKEDDYTNDYDYEDSPLYGVIKDIEKGNIRVKYLDKEDLESLGWIIRDFHSDGTPMLMGGTEIYFYMTDENNHEIEFRYSIKGNYCIIMHTNKEGWVDYEKYLSLFQGRIKNKSELKKLMQQLNIKQC